MSSPLSDREKTHPIKVLVVGQTPPPFGGQAIMIQKMLEGRYERLRFIHVRMNFSDEMDDTGRFQFKKLWRLFDLVLRIFSAWMSHRPPILYYPPGGPNRIPFFRDCFVLICVRPLFRRTVFHFHASGLEQLHRRLTPLEKLLFRRAYSRPDLAIRLSALAPRDDIVVRAKKDIVIPNGIEDVFRQFQEHRQNNSPRILFVGVVSEEKGVETLVDACHLLAEMGVSFSCEIVGRFESQRFAASLERRISSGPSAGRITLHGVLTGDAKWRQYAMADIFCFPTHFESETLPVVIIEAMQFSLPVVATEWKAIPDLVLDGETGFLVPTRDPKTVADKLLHLVNNKDLRERFGKSGRERFLKEFLIEMFQKKIENAFLRI